LQHIILLNWRTNFIGKILKRMYITNYKVKFNVYNNVYCNNLNYNILLLQYSTLKEYIYPNFFYFSSIHLLRRIFSKYSRKLMEKYSNCSKRVIFYSIIQLYRHMIFLDSFTYYSLGIRTLFLPFKNLIA